MENTVKIRVENLYKIFGRNPEKARKMTLDGLSKDDVLEKTGSAVGVADASFAVYEGETLVIMGLSGSGKSTLLRCLNRIHEPTYGKVFVDGQDITAMDANELRELRRTKFAMVFQSFALFPHRTVQANVEFGLEAHFKTQDLLCAGKPAALLLSFSTFLLSLSAACSFLS